MKRPHQKANKISDMTEEECLELADTIETELKEMEGVTYVSVSDENGVMDDDIFEMLDKDDGEVVPSSDNVFADLGLENADELKKTAEKMIAEGATEDQIVSALQSITPNDGGIGEGYYHHVLLIDEIRKTAHEVNNQNVGHSDIRAAAAEESVV